MDELQRLQKRLEREKAARAEAEAIAERSTRDLFDTVAALRRTNLALEATRAQLAREVEILSTPILRVWQDVLLAPVVGTLDPERGQRLVDTVLAAVHDGRAQVVVLDLTGAVAVGAAQAELVGRLAEAVRLLGATLLLSGLSVHVAAAFAELQVEAERVQPHATLEDALRAASARTRSQAR